MKASMTSLGRAVLTSAPLLYLLVSNVAGAQETPPAADPFAEGSAPAAASAANAAPPPAAEQPKPSSLGPFERLPSTAYPEWTTRGLTGGSLWFSGNMHGMPWPYYPKTGIGVSGYAWLDTGYETITRGNPAEPNIKYLLSQGRAVLRVTPTYTNGDLYVQAQTEFVGNKDQTIAQPNVADIDDLWIRIGQWKQWDVQVGRFEAFEVYHFGMGMDLNTLERNGAADERRAAPDVYGLKDITYRQNGVGNVAVHAYPLKFLRLEALGQFGFDAATGIDTIGGRGAAVVDLGWFKLKGEGDYRRQFPVSSASKERRIERGGAGAAQIVLNPTVEAGVNFAYGLIDHWNPQNTVDPNATLGDLDTTGSVTDLDFGGFLNVRVAEDLIVGGGGNYNQETDLAAGRFSHLQAFGAIQYLVFKQLFVKFVGSYARAELEPGGSPPWHNTMVSGRLRLMYLF